MPRKILRGFCQIVWTILFCSVMPFFILFALLSQWTELVMEAIHILFCGDTISVPELDSAINAGPANTDEASTAIAET